MSKKEAKKFVVVCTAKRGVFGGFTSDTSGDVVALTDASMCVYWSSDVRGVVGLAATGPTATCRITQPSPEMIVRDVTASFECTADAEKAWRTCPWG